MQAHLMQALDNLETVLREGGFELSNVVRLNIYTTDVDAYFHSVEAMNTRLAEAGCRFAGTLLGVARLAFPQLLVEIEATAVSAREDGLEILSPPGEEIGLERARSSTISLYTSGDKSGWRSRKETWHRT